MAEIKTILWDVGGPIIREEDQIPKWEVALIEAATEVTGTTISRETFDRINGETIASFAPFVFRTIMFRLVGEIDDLFERGFRLFKEKIPPFSTELQPGIRDLLKELALRYPMAVVANQDAGLVERLETLGIADCFEFILSPSDYGFYKPDTRAFTRVLDYLDIEPQSALMIGDRLDNDVVPAKMLGMQSLLLRAFWHKDQRPRCPEERPDWTVTSIDEMIALLRRELL